MGYEFILDFISHMKGCAMHLGHYIDIFKQTTNSTADNKIFRRLIQSGVAARFASLPHKTFACCENKLIGGDGTCIGIRLQNIPPTALPVWQSTTATNWRTVHDWSRRDRRALSHVSDTIIESMRDVIHGGLSDADRMFQAHRFANNEELQRVDNELRCEFVRWMRLSSTSIEYNTLRMIFVCLCTNECVIGMIPHDLAQSLKLNEKSLKMKDKCSATLAKLSLLSPFSSCGVGPEMLTVLEIQERHYGHALATTVQFFLSLGPLIDWID